MDHLAKSEPVRPPHSCSHLNRLQFAYFGVHVELTWDLPELDDFMARLLLPIWAPDPSLTPNATFHVFAEGEELLIQGPDNETPRVYRPDFFETLERRLHFYLANHCREVAFVHAGAVSWNGQVILIPGTSFSGKSTLTHQLVEAGATYFSDEYAVVDRAGLVHPFPRPIALRQDGGRRLTPTRIGLAAQPVGQMISTQFQTGAKWNPRPISQGQAVLELLSHTVSAQKWPALALACLKACVSRARCWVGARGDASETATLILKSPPV